MSKYFIAFLLTITILFLFVFCHRDVAIPWIVEFAKEFSRNNEVTWGALREILPTSYKE